MFFSNPLYIQSENFLLTFLEPLTPPTPRWGEGGVRRQFQIFLAKIFRL
jgi:hypothetical protein